MAGLRKGSIRSYRKQRAVQSYNHFYICFFLG